MISARGSDLYYSLLGFPAPKKKAVLILRQWAETLNDLAAIQEDSVFEAKWGFWQSELEHLHTKSARHPLAIDFGKVITDYRLPMNLITEYLEGIRVDRNHQHCCSEIDFLALAYRKQSLVQMLLAYVYGFKDPQILHHALHLGRALFLMNEIIYLGAHLAQGRLSFPLSDYPVEAENFWETSDSQTLSMFLSTQSEKAKAHYEKAQSFLSKPEMKTQHPAFIEAELKLAQLALLEEDYSQVLKGYSELTPLRKYWKIWRLRREHGF